MIRVMVVDDHPIWHDGVARDLGARDSEVVATVADGAAALRIIPAARPDVVLMDLHFAPADRPARRPPSASATPGPPSGCWCCPPPVRMPTCWRRYRRAPRDT